jgi:hypothetical protein
MPNLIKLLSFLMISSVSCSDVYNTGRQKYEQILSFSSSQSTCWQQVLSMLHRHCSLDQLDQYQSSIAYQFTLCHLSNMNSDLSNLQCQDNRIEFCVEKLHKNMNAFIGE